jgi:LAGLIDADG DNA endonuclease family protein
MTGSLAWPPTKDDLERLYLVEHLSAAKIAQRYGLKYASPKTAESTILYHLKRAGIARRDSADHVRKVTEDMAKEWVMRYEAGESLKQIAGDKVNPVTVFNHLHKHGLELRDRAEAQIAALTKHPRNPFVGSDPQRAYLIGLTLGDCYIVRHGRAIRVRTSTTHPAMGRLLRELFSASGAVYEYPKESELTGYEWCFDCDLDSSYDFLLNPLDSIPWILATNELFLAFLGGFFDAEGSIFYHKKKSWGAFEFSLRNMNENLLRIIARKLSETGLSPALKRFRQDPDRGVKNGKGFIWRLSLWRYEDVAKILRMLPCRHSEKRAKVEIALTLGFRSHREDRQKIVVEWEALKTRIRSECEDYVDRARRAYLTRKQQTTEG